MEDVTSKDSLELEVNDFGPIVHAKIDLRPLTVFVGPSNTGKSYLAILIYALHQYFSGQSRFSHFALNYDALMDASSRIVESELANSISKFLEQASTAAGKAGWEGNLVLTAPILKAICAVFEVESDQLDQEIRRCFGIDKTAALIRRGRRDCARIELRQPLLNDSATFKHTIALEAQTCEFGTSIRSERPISVDVQDKGGDIEYYSRTKEAFAKLDRMGNEWKRPAMGLLHHLLGLALPHLLGSLYRAASYLPADRTGVMHSHQVVVSALIQNATTAGLRPDSDLPMLSGVLGDFLQKLILLPSSSKHQGTSRKDLGARIEDLILGGSIQVERSELIGYPHFTYQPAGWKHPMPLMNASSMVSEIAPVVMFLRHLVGPGTALIIEEPESHLHPAMQVEFTRQLAALVHAGISVIITTHSEWVLEELANIVRRSELTAAGRKEMPHGEFALRPEQVGAWLFKQKRRPKGSVVKEIRLDDSGLFPSEFDEVARTLHNYWADISSRIGEAE